MSEARLLPGGPVVEAVKADVRERAEKLLANGITPSLATMLVGDDDASAGYIRLKQRTAAELGFSSPHTHLPGDATQQQVEDEIRRYCDDPSVHALLLQYPIPGHLDYDAAIAAMDPDKDVDAAHPTNMGRLALGMPGPVPCTPAGIEALLAHYEIPVSGRHVVILGRGATLGRPLALLLSQKRPTANAAVTVVHTGVPNWPDYTRRAPIVVAAAGDFGAGNSIENVGPAARRSAIFVMAAPAYERAPRRSAQSMAFRKSMPIVVGPTPPTRGVIALATSAHDSSTSGSNRRPS